MSFETVANRTRADYVRPIDLSSFDAFEVTLKDANSPPHSKVQLVASAMQWAGYTIAVVSVFLVMAGNALWTLAVGVSAAFVGSLGSMLSHELGPRRWLKGVRVKDILTPLCFEVPYYTRVRTLADQHALDVQNGCGVVMREGHVMGILLPKDVLALRANGQSDSTVEQHIRPIDWVEGVDVDDDAAGVLEYMRRHRRDFLPVIRRNRLAGIVRQEHIAEVARRAAGVRYPSKGANT
jgi:CBS-domain-containing membrane protein